MSRHRTEQIVRAALPVLLMLAVQACGGKPLVTPSPAGLPTETIPALNPAPTLEAAPSPTATPAGTGTAVSLTLTPSSVTVTAVKGNVFIRRGPDLAYNPISALLEGQSANAIARDVLAKWVQIPLPGGSGKTGWISIQTSFTQVNGNVMSLPEVQVTDWPVLAFLRNCTHHQMEADPVGIIIPPVDAFPDNRVQINPGIYTIHDIDVDHSPEVTQVEMKEGLEIDIRTDGNGVSKKCPVP